MGGPCPGGPGRSERGGLFDLWGGLGLFLQVPENDVPASLAPTNAVRGIGIIILHHQLERAEMVFGIVGLFDSVTLRISRSLALIPGFAVLWLFKGPESETRRSSSEFFARVH
jgi:hypothetical protein